MEKVGAFEAKTHLPKLLDRAAHGECITITRRGKPIAMLVPIEAKSEPSPAEAVSRLRSLRVGHTWGKSMSIKEAVEEGRR